MSSLISLLFALSIGSVSLWAGISVLKSRKRVGQWPEVIGKVIDRTTTRVGIPRGWRLKINYAYTIGGQNYKGNRVFELGNFVIPIGLFNKRFVTHDGILTSHVDPKKLEAEFPSQIPVLYNPKNPSESCLMIQPRSHVWLPLVLGILILSWCLLDSFALVALY